MPNGTSHNERVNLFPTHYQSRFDIVQAEGKDCKPRLTEKYLNRYGQGIRMLLFEKEKHIRKSLDQGSSNSIALDDQSTCQGEGRFENSDPDPRSI